MRHHGNWENPEHYPPLIRLSEAVLRGRECSPHLVSTPYIIPLQYYIKSHMELNGKLCDIEWVLISVLLTCILLALIFVFNWALAELTRGFTFLFARLLDRIRSLTSYINMYLYQPGTTRAL